MIPTHRPYIAASRRGSDGRSLIYTLTGPVGAAVLDAWRDDPPVILRGTQRLRPVAVDKAGEREFTVTWDFALKTPEGAEMVGA